VDLEPDPQDPHVFGPSGSPFFLGHPDPHPLVRGMDPDPSLFHKGVERTEIMLAKYDLTQNFCKK
jgi:hypothetical protein